MTKTDDVIVFIDNGYLKKVSKRFKSQNIFNYDIKKLAINLSKEQEYKIKVILYCLKNKNRHFFLSNHLLEACDFVGLIKKEHFE